MMRINVGCGQSPIPGWRNFDNSLSICLANVPLLPDALSKLGILTSAQREFVEFLRTHDVEYADVTGRLPLGDGTAEVIYSSHMVEHLDREEISRFLREAMRVLGCCSIIRLAIPDIRKQVQQYIESGDADALVEGTNLVQPRPRSFQSRLRVVMTGARHHQWMYDGQSLCRLLTSHGFERAAIVPPGESRISNPEPLDLFERAAESVYVEAEKV